MHKASILRKVCDQFSFFPPPKEKPEPGKLPLKRLPRIYFSFSNPGADSRTWGSRISDTAANSSRKILLSMFRSGGGHKWMLPYPIPSLSAGADQLITPVFPPKWPRVIKEKTGNRPLRAFGLGLLITIIIDIIIIIIIIIICNQLLKTTTNPMSTYKPKSICPTISNTPSWSFSSASAILQVYHWHLGPDTTILQSSPSRP